MRRPRRRNQPLLIALYLNAAVMLAILVAMLARGNGGNFLPAAYGAVPSPQPIAGGGSLYLMPAQFTPNSWGCYILDIDTQTLCAYRYHPTNDGTDLQLVAARKVTADRKLTNFNSNKPTPDEVKQWVEQAAQGVRGQNAASPTPAAPAPGGGASQ